MKTPTASALAAVILLAVAATASASPLAGSKMAPPAKDTLALSGAQQKTAWNDLYVGNLNQKPPPGFGVAVGAVVPSKIATSPVWLKAAGDVPALKRYNFAIVQKKLVIVNPNDHKIVDVIAG